MTMHSPPALLKDVADMAAGAVTILAWLDVLNSVLTMLLTIATLAWVLWRLWDRYKHGAPATYDED